MTLQNGFTDRILIIRLSAMGDIIHTLPAAASLKKSFPESRMAWLIASRWMPLVEGNPYVDELIPFDRSSLSSLHHSWRSVRNFGAAAAFDFQGLLQSAIIGRAARPKFLFGFDRSVARESFAASLYTHCVPVHGPHRVERNLQLAEYAGARELSQDAWIPEGCAEGQLPSTPFILANPFAGWPGKEWPLLSYERLAEILQRHGLELVLNVPENRAAELSHMKHIRIQVSSLRGLINATRRAAAVVGLDSGPLHLAAALRKPGVALYGPTDPVSTGPFGGTLKVLRTDDAETTYKRHGRIHSSMKAISAEQVAEAVLRSIARAHSEALVSRS